MEKTARQNSDARKLDDSYELVSVLGRGANSIVYLAQPTPEKREELSLPGFVTIKIFSDIDSPEEKMERLKKEALFLKSIRSPRVLKVYDYKCTETSCYLVLEYAENGDVKSLMEKCGRLEPGIALRFGIQLLDALTAVHSAGIIHRDVKPENILIAADGTIRLGDFGVSCFSEHARLAASDGASVRGTWGYIAPEQLQGDVETVASDIFAAAVTIFEMLTNRLPFETKSMSELLKAMIEGELLQIANLFGEEYLLLDTVLRRGLSNDPENRFHSALRFRRALEEVVWNLEVGQDLQKRLKLAQEKRKPRYRENKSTQQRVHRSSVVQRVAYNAQSLFERKSVRILSLVSLTVVLGVVIAFKDSAGAHLRRSAPASIRNSVDGLLSRVFDYHTAFNNAKILGNSLRSGILYNFLADGQHTTFSTAPFFGESGSSTGESFLFSLGLPGWKPVLVTLNDQTGSNELQISGSGMRFAMRIEKVSHDPSAAISGQLVDLSTGRNSRFTIY